MFSIVHCSPQTIWVPVLGGQTIYNGSIISGDTSALVEGIQPLPIAAGASNTTNKDIPFGVVVGNNNLKSTVGADSYITAAAQTVAYGSTAQFQSVEGPWAKGDPIAMVQVQVIDPTAVLRANLYDTTLGVAPPPVAVSTASGADGKDCVTAAATVATVATYSTIYMRSGANMGVYRTLTSASDATHTWLQAMKSAVAVGDSALILNGLRPYGLCKMQTDATARFIDVNAALTSDYFYVNVLRLDLSEAGNEYVEFQFGIENFLPLTART